MSKRFHASPKGMLAVLACLALLCSLFAFSLTVLADPAGDYTPSRYLKLTNTTDSEPMFILKTPADQYPAANGPYTLSFMLKAENLKGIKGDASGDEDSTKVPDVQIMNGWSDMETQLKADTEGYIECEYEIAQPSELEFALLWTAGSLYIADLVITDKDDKVVYSLNWDDTLIGMTEFASTATWTSALYNTGKNEIPAGATFEIYDDTDMATYEPTRYMKLTNTGDIQPQFRLKLAAEQFPTGDNGNGPYNLSFNLKLENYETKDDAKDWSNGGKGEVEVKNGSNLLTANGGTALAEDTDGYVHYSFDLGKNPSELSFGFCYGLGDLYIADLVIRDKDGVIRYSMNNDASLNDMTDFVAGENCPWTTSLYDTQDGATFTVFTDADHDINRDPVVIVTDAPVVELPDFDPGADPVNPTDFNRSITIVNKDAQTSTAYLTLFRDDAVPPEGFVLDPDSVDGPYALDAGDGPFYLVGKMKLTGFEGEKAVVLVNNQEKIALTANTNGWVDLKDASGNYLSLDMSAVDFATSIRVALSSASGEFSIADLRIVDKDNNIVYSLANDTYLYGLSDLSTARTQYKAFINEDFDADGLDYGGWRVDGKGKFNVLSKNEKYVPNKVLTMIVDEEHKAVNPLFIFCNAYADPELWENGPFTITGKLRVDQMDKMDASKTPGVFLAGKSYSVTDGWVSFADVMGEIPSFEFQPDKAHYYLSVSYAYAKVSIADVVMYDKDGKVIFDMAEMEDEDGYYKSGANLGGGRIGLATFSGSDQQYLLLSNPEPVKHTADEYLLPVFEETGIEGGIPAPTPDPDPDPDPSTPDGPKTGAETPVLFCVVLGVAALGMALIVSKKKVRG